MDYILNEALEKTMNALCTETSSTVGNFTCEPNTILKYLKKSTYYLDYDPKERKITFWANDGYGGEVLFELQPSSYENAKKIAEGLNLKENQRGHWGKWNPKLVLESDGSQEAETLRMEMLRLSIPFEIRKTSELALLDSYHRHTFGSMWPLEELLKIIRETAERYKEQLKTVP